MANILIITCVILMGIVIAKYVELNYGVGNAVGFTTLIIVMIFGGYRLFNYPKL